MKQCVLIKGRNEGIIQALLDDGLDVIHLDKERLITYYEKPVSSIRYIISFSRKLDLSIISFPINQIYNNLSAEEINMIKKLDKIKVNNFLESLSSDDNLSH